MTADIEETYFICLYLNWNKHFNKIYIFNYICITNPTLYIFLQIRTIKIYENIKI